MIELPGELFETIINGVDSSSSDLWVHAKPDSKRDMFVLRGIVRHQNTFQGILTALHKKKILSSSLRNTERTYRSCKNLLLAAEVMRWSKDMKDEMRNFLKDPEITDSIEKWMSKIAQGEDRPVLDISRPLPHGMRMDTFKQFIGYYDTDRFACNYCVLMALFILLGTKLKIIRSKKEQLRLQQAEMINSSPEKGRYPSSDDGTSISSPEEGQGGFSEEKSSSSYSEQGQDGCSEVKEPTSIPGKGQDGLPAVSSSFPEKDQGGISEVSTAIPEKGQDGISEESSSIHEKDNDKFREVSISFPENEQDGSSEVSTSFAEKGEDKFPEVSTSSPEKKHVQFQEFAESSHSGGIGAGSVEDEVSIDLFGGHRLKFRRFKH